jgi:hypothetical protein
VPGVLNGSIITLHPPTGKLPQVRIPAGKWLVGLFLFYFVYLNEDAKADIHYRLNNNKARHIL